MIDLIGQAALTLLGVWLLACWRLKLLSQAHHALYGALLALPEQYPWWLRLPGLLVLADDALGHAYELLPGKRGKRSPLHRLFYRLFPHAP